MATGYEGRGSWRPNFILNVFELLMSSSPSLSSIITIHLLIGLWTNQGQSQTWRPLVMKAAGHEGCRSRKPRVTKAVGQEGRGSRRLSFLHQITYIFVDHHHTFAQCILSYHDVRGCRRLIEAKWLKYSILVASLNAKRPRSELWWKYFYVFLFRKCLILLKYYSCSSLQGHNHWSF